jgi:hypothetical protein
MLLNACRNIRKNSSWLEWLSKRGIIRHFLVESGYSLIAFLADCVCTRRRASTPAPKRGAAVIDESQTPRKAEKKRQHRQRSDSFLHHIGLSERAAREENRSLREDNVEHESRMAESELQHDQKLAASLLAQRRQFRIRTFFERATLHCMTKLVADKGRIFL